MADSINDYDIFDFRPDVTKQMLRTKTSNDSTRREYLRMKSEKEVTNRQSHATSTCFVHEEPVRRQSIIDREYAIKLQNEELEVTAFPFVDVVDGVAKNTRSALASYELVGHTHGAKLSMISAIAQMKCLAHRRAKSTTELKKKPLTTLDVKNRSKNADSDGDEEEEESPFSYLKKCRYLRGVKQDQELTIEEIFG